MPHIIRTNEIVGLHADLMKAAERLKAIWNDKQYQYFMEKYVEPLEKEMREMEETIKECSFFIYDRQSKLESL